MINELIEKEIEKCIGKVSENSLVYKDELRESLQTIAKEVAIRFKRDEVDYDRSHYRDYNERVREDNNLADQIINEVSE